MGKETNVKLFLFGGLLLLFLLGSRFRSEERKIVCIEGQCTKPHDHGQLGYHEHFPVNESDHFIVAVIKSSANFWEANATGMTFAIVLGAAAFTLVMSHKKIGNLLAMKGIRGAGFGSIVGMPLNMCANCSAVTSVGMTSKGGTAEVMLGVIMGGALLNIIGLITMFGLFSPAVVISRILFSIVMIIAVVPLVSRLVRTKEQQSGKRVEDNIISCYIPDQTLQQIVIKSLKDWIIAVGNISIKLIPLMLLGTLLTAVFKVVFPNETMQALVNYNPVLMIIIISLIGTLLSVPVLFEILLASMLLNLGFSNGPVASMLFAAPGFGLFTLVLTKEKLGGFKVPVILLITTFILAVCAGLFAEFLTGIF